MPNFTGYPLATNYTNASPVRDVHPAAHNAVDVAVNSLQDQINGIAVSIAGGLLFTQASAASTWTITHALPFRPSVTVTDSAGTWVIPESITYVSDTQIQVTFGATFSGKASLA